MVGRQSHVKTAAVGVLLVAFLGLWACTTSTPKAASESPLSAAESARLDEMRHEVELGRNLAGRLLQAYGVVDSEELTGYINQVGNYVAAYSDFTDRRYMFAVLATQEVNAFACPGGYIFITEGALRLARNEAELAMVLGHEVAHVGGRHMYNTLKGMSAEELDRLEKEAQAKLPPAMAARKRPEGGEQPEFMSAVSKVVMRASGGSAAFALNAATAGTMLMLKKGIDHDLEFEADRLGTRFAVRAGYDPKSVKAYIARLAKAKKGQTEVLSATHPSPTLRLKGVSEVMKDLDAEEIIGATGEERFKKHLSVLPKSAARQKR